MSDNAGELAKAAQAMAMAEVKKLLTMLDDDDTEEALGWLLVKHWKSGEDGNARIVQWMCLGRAVENIQKALAAGNYGQGRTYLANQGKRTQMLAVLNTIYHLADEIRAQDEEEAYEEGEDE